jgi:hypothetical protein
MKSTYCEYILEKILSTSVMKQLEQKRMPVAFFLIVLLSEVRKRKQRESLKGMQGLKKYFNI